MTVLLQPLREQDIPEFTRNELTTFQTHPRTAILWPRGYTPDFWSFQESKKYQAFASPSSAFIKLVDSSTNRLIGGAQWTLAITPEAYQAEEPIAEDALPPDDWPLDGNWAVRRWFLINSQKIMNRDMSGRAYIIPEFLTVLPAYQGKGLGARLMNWGVTQADRLQCRMCLESTPAGLALYKKFGFAPVETISCDMRALGATTDYREEDAQRIFMIREPGAGKPTGLAESEIIGLEP